MNEQKERNVDSKDIVLTENAELKAGGLQLQRTVTLLGAISFTVGSMIGSGIFIMPTSVMRNTGSVALNLLVWSLGGVLSMLGSLTVAELACRVPKHGGTYAYLREGIGDWLAFLFTWNHVIIAAPAGLAVRSLTFARYLLAMVPHTCGEPQLLVSLIAVAFIVLLFILNITSNRISVWINVTFLFAKLLALAVIIIGGLVALITGNNRGNSELSSGFKGTLDNSAAIASSFYFVMSAYAGWSNANVIVEEVKNPKRNVPLAAICGVVIVTFIYVLTNLSYLAVMSRLELLSSDTVAETWGNAVLGTGAASLIIPLCVLFSTTGSANASTFGAPRVIFAAARDSNIPEVMSYLHVHKRTPVPAISVIIIVAIFYALVSGIREMVIVVNITEWMFNFLCAVCLLIIRHKQPKGVHVPFKQPLAVIVLFMLAALYIVIVPWTSGVSMVLVYVLVFLFIGIILFVVFSVCKRRASCCDGPVVCLQLLCDLAPPMAFVPDD